MRISEVEVEYSDIEWFATDKKQKIMRFTSGLYGYVPEFVCASKENVEVLCKFFRSLKRSTDAMILQNDNFGNKLLDECKQLSQKGIYCFDSFDGVKDSIFYTKISEPMQPVLLYTLPQHIQNIMKFNILDVDVDHINIINVTNAY